MCGVNSDEFRSDWWNADEASIFEADEPYDRNRKSFIYFVYSYIISLCFVNLISLVFSDYYWSVILPISLITICYFRNGISEGYKVIEIPIAIIIILIYSYSINSFESICK